MVEPRGNPIPAAAATASSDDMAHVTQEMYKQNLELVERNKTLSLLRQIDEIVLSSSVGTRQVSQQIATKVAAETDFDLVMLMVADKKLDQLVTTAVCYGQGEKTVPPELTNELLANSIKLPPSPLLVQQAIKTQKVVFTQSLEQLSSNKLNQNLLHSLQTTMGLRSSYISALVARGELIGLMVIGSRLEAVSISDYQQNLIERLTAVMGIALDNKMLYEEIQAATAQLQVQNKRLKELDEAKDEFISMASHQLRTPLTAIKGYTSMLQEGDAGVLNAKQHEFANLAYVSAQRMVFLISDMLNVSRINTGKLVIDKAPMDLEMVVQDEIRLLQHTAETKGVKFTYQGPTIKLPMLSLDEGKMRQVIMNFLDNATYYAPNTTVGVSVESAEGKARLVVKDHGIGVPAEAQKHLFTKFYRAINAQKSRPDGTGLGLFMAKMVVELQQGSLIFSSVEGKGSTFGFEFPLSAIQTKAKAVAKPATKPAPASAVAKL